MAIEFEKHRVVFQGGAGVEEAERLAEWLQNEPGAEVDLAPCSHLHAADLQVLMASRIAVADWPVDADLAAWLRTALHSA